tara:strand:+ start:1647 stop:2312 length:666 start_codon:yes stop_codon:yes gene_type:complete
MKTTKKELIYEIDNLKNELRKAKRAINHLCLDINASEKKERDFIGAQNSTIHSEKALKRASNEWSRNVTEPEYKGDWQRITDYIHSSEGLNWYNDSYEYKKNGEFSWCGAFVAFCYSDVILNTRKKIFPSCYRMYENWYDTRRRVKVIHPGDIVTVFSSAKKFYGDHIVLAIDYPDENGDFPTYEGNAKGQGPNGKIEGVIKRKRNLKNVACIYRLSAEDF